MYGCANAMMPNYGSANLFAPLLLFNCLFVMWLAGALSVLAHSEVTTSR